MRSGVVSCSLHSLFHSSTVVFTATEEIALVTRNSLLHRRLPSYWGTEQSGATTGVERDDIYIQYRGGGRLWASPSVAERAIARGEAQLAHIVRPKIRATRKAA